MTKLIIHGDPENWILAMRCAKYLVNHPECGDVVTSFGNVLTEPDYYAKRNKKSGTITVREIKRA